MRNLLFFVVTTLSAADFNYNILSVRNTAPGQSPEITFSVTNGAGQPYDLKNHPAFTQTASGASRLFLQIGWDTRDYTNTGSGSELARVGPAAALPIAINGLASSIPVGNGAYRVVSPRPLPSFVAGTGVVAMEGHPAGPDATGAYTVRIPVKSVYRYFPVTGTAIVPRRQVVDVAKCKTCHGTLTLHGNNRTDEPQVCVVCHNPNATDIAYRQPADGPEVPIDFKRMVHAIHAAKMRKSPLIIIGFNHSVNNFSTVRFPGELNRCLTCHLDRTFELPMKSTLGTTTKTNSVINLAGNIVNNDPKDDLKITPTAAVCSACHDDERRHMEQNGASFATLQQSIDSGAVRERCVNCHGPGKEKDVRKVHSTEERERRDP